MMALGRVHLECAICQSVLVLVLAMQSLISIIRVAGDHRAVACQAHTVIFSNHRYFICFMIIETFFHAKLPYRSKSWKSGELFIVHCLQ